MCKASWSVASALIASIQLQSRADPACELPRLDPIAGAGYTATYYGNRVSGMDLEGDVLAVGAAGEDESSPSDQDCNSGAVDVFVWNGSQWIERVRLTAPTPACHEGFGRSVAISGNRIAVGAQNGTYGDIFPDPDATQGKAYVFLRNDNGTPGSPTDDTWSCEDCTIASPRVPPTAPDCFSQTDGREDRFGISLDLDGDVLVVGAFNVECKDGEAYVYRRSGTDWDHEATLSPPGDLNGRFGERVAISSDTIAVAAPVYSEGLLNRGAVYVYKKSPTSWDVQQPDPILGDGGRFGTGLALDGDRLVGGSPQLTCAGNAFGGQAGLFVRSGGSWTQQATFEAPDCGPSTEFGAAPSIRGDTIAIGASSHTERGLHSGAAYVFRLNGSAWSFDEQIFPACSFTGDAFATAIALSSTPPLGEVLGAVATSNQIGGIETGSAYVFDLQPAACAALDNDSDGILEGADLCCEDPRNAVSACDTDSDGYGNVCDPDFNQDDAITSTDFGMLFVPAFKGTDPSPWPEGMDMNCDGSVTSVDFGMFFLPKFTTPGESAPGPSGLACAGAPPCS